MHPAQNPSFQRAIESLGGCTAMAQRLNTSVQAVTNWKARGAPPASKCAAIEAITGVDRRELRPDDWADYWPEAAKVA